MVNKKDIEEAIEAIKHADSSLQPTIDVVIQKLSVHFIEKVGTGNKSRFTPYAEKFINLIKKGLAEQQIHN